MSSSRLLIMVRDYSLTMISTQRGDRLYRLALLAIGAMATSTGTAVVLRGSAAVPGGGSVTASTDSVLRFYALWWAALGPVMVHLATRPPQEREQLTAVAALTALGGLARILAAFQSGLPHPLFRALTVVELTAPPALLLWQRRLPDDPSPRRCSDHCR